MRIQIENVSGPRPTHTQIAAALGDTPKRARADNDEPTVVLQREAPAAPGTPTACTVRHGSKRTALNHRSLTPGSSVLKVSRPRKKGLRWVARIPAPATARTSSSSWRSATAFV